MPKQIDQETKKAISEQGLLKDFTKHPGWNVAKGKLIQTIAEMQDASTIDLGMPPEQIVSELATRRMVAMTLYNWIRDVEGTASMADSFSTLIKESHIVRH